MSNLVLRRFQGDWRILVVAVAALGGLASPRATAQEAPYRSPYRVEFHWPLGELIGDLERTERGDPRLAADIPFDRWYSRATREREGAWGPVPRRYPAAPEVERWPVERQRERAVAVALRFVGLGYQHHHLPYWEPPADWPWKPTCAGRNGPGVDCSNFTGFVYNQGFGLHLNTEILHQSEQRVVPGPGPRRETAIERIELPADYDERVRTLKTGDLLYVRSDAGQVSHVVLWIGPIGESPDGSPLILDSHGAGVSDADGRTIPCGIQLRPFRKTSWYNRSASHAHRLLRQP